MFVIVPCTNAQGRGPYYVVAEISGDGVMSVVDGPYLNASAASHCPVFESAEGKESMKAATPLLEEAKRS